MASFQEYRETSQRNTSMESIEPASLLEANIRAEATRESHLQSLGFVVNEGRPRFKVDEPVGSAIGLQHSRSGPSTMRSTPAANFMDLDEESFVVLGKDSLSSIQAASLASYAQIERKSLSTDYNSVISSLTAEETEKKLKELLQENVKLKETLKQNNSAMKQQFNTLATWQEEISKVHQSHKQKFSETKELISQLRKENMELKMKVSQENVVSSDHGLKMKELEVQLQKTLKAQKAIQSAREIELEATNSKLITELSESKMACNALTNDLNRYTILSNCLSQQLNQADLTNKQLKLDVERLELHLKEKEQLASLADFSLLSTHTRQLPELDIANEKSRRLEEEVKHLRKLVTSLQQQLSDNSQQSCITDTLLSGDNSSHQVSGDRLQFVQNVKQYNESLQSLSSSYSKQGSRYVNIQECLKESIDTLDDLGKIVSNKDSSVLRQEQQDKLAASRAKLNAEQLELISERQELLKTQSQLQKVFADYNSVLYQLEIMHAKNSEPNCKEKTNNDVTLEQQQLSSAASWEESLVKEKKLLEDARASILKEKSGIVEERMAKEALQTKCQNLQDVVSEMQRIQEAERKTFSIEKIALQNTIKELQTKNEDFEQTVSSKLAEIDDLTMQITAFKEKVETIPILQAQNQLFEEDFREERQAREQLSAKNNELIAELQKLQIMHKDLVATLQGTSNLGEQQQQREQQREQQPPQTSASAPPLTGTGSNDASSPIITAFSCPMCSKSFTQLDPLRDHVETCLDLQS